MVAFLFHDEHHGLENLEKKGFRGRVPNVRGGLAAVGWSRKLSDHVFTPKHQAEVTWKRHEAVNSQSPTQWHASSNKAPRPKKSRLVFRHLLRPHWVVPSVVWYQTLLL